MITNLLRGKIMVNAQDVELKNHFIEPLETITDCGLNDKESNISKTKHG